MDLPPDRMWERAIDYLLMAEEASSEETRETFLRVAARLQDLAREATAASLERREISPPPAAPPARPDSYHRFGHSASRRKH